MTITEPTTSAHRTELSNDLNPAALQIQAAEEHYVKHCPKCGSVRVHRSRRRGPMERLLSALGASICRCHDCRARQAWFGITPLPIGNTDPEVAPWLSAAFFASGIGMSLLLLWLFVTRIAQPNS
ncbi:MAG: hypothetical protein ABL967_06145 [Bryobacteraceae bacterium]